MKPMDFLLSIPPRLASMVYKKDFPLYKKLYFSYKTISDYSLISFFKNNVKKDMTVLDIGANIGFYSVLLARLVGEHGYVHSFEPCKETFQKLSNTTAAYPQVICNQTGIWNKTGKIMLHYSSIGNVDNWLHEDNFNSGNSKESTMTTTLDEYCRKKAIKPDIIKMDIQGAEYYALQGFRTTITHHIDKIIILMELWPYGLKRCGSSADALIKLIKEMNLNIFTIRGAKLENFRLNNLSMSNYTNIVVKR